MSADPQVHGGKNERPEYPRKPGECLFLGGHVYEPGVDVCPWCGRRQGSAKPDQTRTDPGRQGEGR